MIRTSGLGNEVTQCIDSNSARWNGFPLERLNSVEFERAVIAGAATKIDIVAHSMQIDALQNIDCCDDFDDRRRSAILDAFKVCSSGQL